MEPTPDELIKINLKYLDDLSERRLSSFERAESGFRFQKVEAFEFCMASLALEVIGQYYEFILAMNDGRSDVADIEFSESMRAKMDFVMARRRSGDALN